MADPSLCGMSAPGASDFYHLAVSSSIGTADVIYTRNGSLFIGYGVAHGAPSSVVGPWLPNADGTKKTFFQKFGISLTAGTLCAKKHTPQDVDDFVSGASAGVSAFFGPGLVGIGGAYSFNSSGSAIEAGFGTPGFAFQPVDYMARVFKNLPGW
ncbi:hypothetical protein [Trinickia sp.]|uniref:hypothetical protein n=1 Tax=Trinickia sp. TaxID=2571163 RepID=UPI003F7D3657